YSCAPPSNSELELNMKISDTTIYRRNCYLEEPFEESIPIASANLLLSEKLSSLLHLFEYLWNSFPRICQHQNHLLCRTLHGQYYNILHYDVLKGHQVG